jgi:sporadic carbohydrate cluster 2OG-Fe(II) oxygenase
MKFDLKHINDHFLAFGWYVLDLIDREPLDEARDALLSALRRETGLASIGFERYHETIADDAVHLRIQGALTEELRTGRHCQRIVAAQLAFFQAFLGPDLATQRMPYLRIARPGIAADNVGYHRDTQYGRSPYEVSVLIPFVDLPSSMALRIMPASHVLPESDFPTTQHFRDDVEKGGFKHKLGFPYAPKVMSSDVEARLEPVPVSYGQVLLFSLSTVHGQQVNEGPFTRFSADSRVVNELAPVPRQASVSGEYYEVLTRSAVTEQACRYHQANASAEAEGNPVPTA